MVDNNKGQYQLNRVVARDVGEAETLADGKKGEIKHKMKSEQVSKDKMYGKQFKNGKKYDHASRVWNKNRPLATGGSRPMSSKKK